MIHLFRSCLRTPSIRSRAFFLFLIAASLLFVTLTDGCMPYDLRPAVTGRRCPSRFQVQNISAFVDLVQQMGLPCDFVSTHLYPTDPNCMVRYLLSVELDQRSQAFVSCHSPPIAWFQCHALPVYLLFLLLFPSHPVLSDRLRLLLPTNRGVRRDP